MIQDKFQFSILKTYFPCNSLNLTIPTAMIISAIVDHNHIKPTLKIQKTVSLLKVYYLLCDEWTIANAYEEKQIVFTAIKKSMPKGKYFKSVPLWYIIFQLTPTGTSSLRK